MDETRWVPDIGMFALDRPRFDIHHAEGVTSGSCSFATEFCKSRCYNEKLERLYPKMLQKDVRNAAFWDWLNGDRLRAILARKRNPTDRFRGCTRGENLSSLEDIWKWFDICTKNPDTQFWLPTRAWYDPHKKALNLWMILEIEASLMILPNAHVMASVDPDNEHLWGEIETRRWPVMFFGDDGRTVTPDGSRLFLCPKTHKHLKGHCDTCKAGCFAKQIGRQARVHLLEH